MENLRQILAEVKPAVVQAGEIIAASFGKLKQNQVRLKGLNDYVTAVDLKVEEQICRELERKFPGIPVYSEERAAEVPAADLLWVLDPLDGTANFIHSIPFVSISLALTSNQHPVLGLIYDPLHRDLFTATKKDGAYLNEQKIQVSTADSLKGGFAATGFPFRNLQGVAEYCSLLRSLFDRLSGLRRCGSAALDLAYTAAGRYDFFFEAYLMPWDFMAGKILIEEAGGRVTNFQGSEPGLQISSIVAAANLQFQSVLEEVQKYFAGKVL